MKLSMKEKHLDVELEGWGGNANMNSLVNV